MTKRAHGGPKGRRVFVKRTFGKHFEREKIEQSEEGVKRGKEERGEKKFKVMHIES